MLGIEKLTESPAALLIGYGPGISGPASLRSASPLIVENQFLQIALEFGLIGLLIFLLALYQVFKIAGAKGAWTRLGLRQEERRSALPLRLALVGLLVAGLFTHSFEETTTVILLGALMGLTDNIGDF